MRTAISRNDLQTHSLTYKQTHTTTTVCLWGSAHRGIITVQFCVRIFEFKELCIYAMLGCDEVYQTPKNLTIKRNQKRWAYNQRVVEVEHGSFTPLVFSATGGMSTAASICYKQIAVKLSEKSNTPYTMTMAWLRTNISFSLLRLAIQCINWDQFSLFF